MNALAPDLPPPDEIAEEHHRLLLQGGDRLLGMLGGGVQIFDLGHVLRLDGGELLAGVEEVVLQGGPLFLQESDLLEENIAAVGIGGGSGGGGGGGFSSAMGFGVERDERPREGTPPRMVS